jgi:hypothetical protein
VSTSIDAPPVASGPPDGPEDGDGWLQREMQRRMAERGAGRGGRHARREVAEPPRGVDHVPRHAVATPGPGALRPAPIGGPPRPAGPPASAGAGWSRPDTEEAPPPPVPAVVVPAPAPPADPPAPAPPPAAPSAPVAEVVAHPAVVRPVAAPPEPVREPAPEVLGGPSRSGRPAPRAFRRQRSVDVRSILHTPPAEFGGPRFHEPDTYVPPEPQEPDSFGGPLFHEPATPSPRPTEVVDAAAVGLDFDGAPRSTTIATGPAADVLPPRDPARLLAAPSRPADVETTAQLTALVVHDDDDDDLDDDDLDGLDDMAGDDGVLWSRGDPGPEPLVPEAQRTVVVLSERRARARPVRNVETLQDGSVVGELLRTDLIRSQLGLALRSAVAAGLFLGLLPLVFALFPAVGEMEVLGFRLPWVLLGVAVYPFLWLLGRLHTRSAERIEREFADQVQD